MGFLRNLRFLLIWGILAEAASAHVIHRRDAEETENSKLLTDDLRTPQKYIIEPVQTITKVADNLEVPPYDEVDFATEDKFNEIEGEDEVNSAKNDLQVKAKEAKDDKENNVLTGPTSSLGKTSADSKAEAGEKDTSDSEKPLAANITDSKPTSSAEEASTDSVKVLGRTLTGPTSSLRIGIADSKAEAGDKVTPDSKKPLGADIPDVKSASTNEETSTDSEKVLDRTLTELTSSLGIAIADSKAEAEDKSAPESEKLLTADITDSKPASTVEETSTDSEKVIGKTLALAEGDSSDSKSANDEASAKDTENLLTNDSPPNKEDETPKSEIIKTLKDIEKTLTTNVAGPQSIVADEVDPRLDNDEISTNVGKTLANNNPDLEPTKETESEHITDKNTPLDANNTAGDNTDYKSETTKKTPLDFTSTTDDKTDSTTITDKETPLDSLSTTEDKTDSEPFDEEEKLSDTGKALGKNLVDEPGIDDKIALKPTIVEEAPLDSARTASKINVNKKLDSKTNSSEVLPSDDGKTLGKNLPEENDTKTEIPDKHIPELKPSTEGDRKTILDSGKTLVRNLPEENEPETEILSLSIKPADKSIAESQSSTENDKEAFANSEKTPPKKVEDSGFAKESNTETNADKIVGKNFIGSKSEPDSNQYPKIKTSSSSKTEAFNSDDSENTIGKNILESETASNLDSNVGISADSQAEASKSDNDEESLKKIVDETNFKLTEEEEIPSDIGKSLAENISDSTSTSDDELPAGSVNVGISPDTTTKSGTDEESIKNIIDKTDSKSTIDKVVPAGSVNVGISPDSKIKSDSDVESLKNTGDKTGPKLTTEEEIPSDKYIPDSKSTTEEETPTDADKIPTKNADESETTLNGEPSTSSETQLALDISNFSRAADEAEDKYAENTNNEKSADNTAGKMNALGEIDVEENDKTELAPTDKTDDVGPTLKGLDVEENDKAELAPINKADVGPKLIQKSEVTSQTPKKEASENISSPTNVAGLTDNTSTASAKTDEKTKSAIATRTLLEGVQEVSEQISDDVVKTEETISSVADIAELSDGSSTTAKNSDDENKNEAATRTLLEGLEPANESIPEASSETKETPIDASATDIAKKTDVENTNEVATRTHLEGLNENKEKIPEAASKTEENSIYSSASGTTKKTDPANKNESATHTLLEGLKENKEKIPEAASTTKVITAEPATDIAELPAAKKDIVAEGATRTLLKGVQETPEEEHETSANALKITSVTAEDVNKSSSTNGISEIPQKVEKAASKPAASVTAEASEEISETIGITDKSVQPTKYSKSSETLEKNKTDIPETASKTPEASDKSQDNDTKPIIITQQTTEPQKEIPKSPETSLDDINPKLKNINEEIDQLYKEYQDLLQINKGPDRAPQNDEKEAFESFNSEEINTISTEPINEKVNAEELSADISNLPTKPQEFSKETVAANNEPLSLDTLGTSTKTSEESEDSKVEIASSEAHSLIPANAEAQYEKVSQESEILPSTEGITENEDIEIKVTSNLVENLEIVPIEAGALTAVDTETKPSIVSTENWATDVPQSSIYVVQTQNLPDKTPLEESIELTNLLNSEDEFKIPQVDVIKPNNQQEGNKPSIAETSSIIPSNSETIEIIPDEGNKPAITEGSFIGPANSDKNEIIPEEVNKPSITEGSFIGPANSDRNEIIPEKIIQETLQTPSLTSSLSQNLQPITNQKFSSSVTNSESVNTMSIPPKDSVKPSEIAASPNKTPTSAGKPTVTKNPKPIAPKPVRNPPAPVRNPPAPVRNPPAPVRNPPAPVRNPPAPVKNPPAPVKNPPAPVRNPPAPVRNTPAPVRNPPAPVRNPPKPGNSNANEVPGSPESQNKPSQISSNPNKTPTAGNKPSASTTETKPQTEKPVRNPFISLRPSRVTTEKPVRVVYIKTTTAPKPNRSNTPSPATPPTKHSNRKPTAGPPKATATQNKNKNKPSSAAGSKPNNNLAPVPTQKPVPAQISWFSNFPNPAFPGFFGYPFNTSNTAAPTITTTTPTANKNQTQSSFGVGFLAVPWAWRPLNLTSLHFFSPNRVTETTPPKEDVQTPELLARDMAFWNSLFHRSNNTIKQAKPTTTSTPNKKNATSSPGFFRPFGNLHYKAISIPEFFKLLKANDTTVNENNVATIPADTQILHLYMPLKFPFQGKFVQTRGRQNGSLIPKQQAQSVSNKLEKIRSSLKPDEDDELKTGSEKNSTPAESPEAEKTLETVVVDAVKAATTTTEEKGSLLFELEMPKPVVQLVNSFMTLMPAKK